MLTVTTEISERTLRTIGREVVDCEIYDRFSLAAIRFSGMIMEEVLDALVQERQFLDQVAYGVEMNGKNFLDDPMDFVDFRSTILEKLSDWIMECEDIIANVESTSALDKALAMVQEAGYTVKAA